MINGKSILAVVPARAGSKRLPGKNIKKLAGKPLIQWTLDAALECDLIDEIIVNTDDFSIAELAKSKGVNVPFIRPFGLAQDTSSSVDVLIHTLEYYTAHGDYFDYIMMLQPTSPLRNVNHIYGAIEALDEKQADAIISVCKTDHPPLWTNTLDETCSMDTFLHKEIKNVRSQDLPDYFRLNGAIYLVNTERLLAEKTMFISNNIYAYKMDRKSSIDIDESIDFLLAELLFES
ncbi:acylneuraminate cytidylyltransferase family protein [Amylibacter sp.]|jgi:CMP-N-acetylneuraminic acid synthetase|nr:acylneuraminate cytidylyltransferase family protein [Amylibacter sp.]